MAAILFLFIGIGVGLDCIDWDTDDIDHLRKIFGYVVLGIILLTQGVAIIGYIYIIYPYNKILK